MDMNNIKLADEAVAAIENGNLIQAIKITRTNSGMGLKESKELVEIYLENNPALKEKLMANRMASGMTQERIIHGLIVVISAIIAYAVFADKF